MSHTHEVDREMGYLRRYECGGCVEDHPKKRKTRKKTSMRLSDMSGLAGNPANR
jgi:hypothetical protein